MTEQVAAAKAVNADVGATYPEDADVEVLGIGAVVEGHKVLVYVAGAASE